MADFDIRMWKIIGIYALVLAILYLVFGVLEVLGIVIGGDLLGGVASVVIAATYLKSVRRLFNGEHKGLSFLIGGLFLSAVFGILYLLLMVADGLMYLLGEVGEFSILADFRLEIWFFFFSLPLAYQTWLLTREVTR